jgi:hypothetical protein
MIAGFEGDKDAILGLGVAVKSAIVAAEVKGHFTDGNVLQIQTARASSTTSWC